MRNETRLLFNAYVSQIALLNGVDSATVKFSVAPAVEQTPGSAPVSLRDLQCAEDSCSPVIGNVAVYRDFTHMTATFVRTLTPFFIDRVEAAVAEARATAPTNG